jgi:transmembrane sensor
LSKARASALSRPVREQAADWLVRRQERGGRDDAAFVRWLAESPEHKQAFDEVSRAWEGLGAMSSVGAVNQMRNDALMAYPPRRAGKTWSVAIAASAAIAIVAVGAHELSSRYTARQSAAFAVQEYRSSRGERASITLRDGSVVTLDTNSRLQVQLGPRERRLRLLAGQAYFEVAHDSSRPFIVTAADRDIVAIGTQFDVRLDGARTSVTLAQGRVEVRPVAKRAGTVHVARLIPGQRMHYQVADPDFVIGNVDVSAVTSWREGRLRFDDVRLADAVAEMNRYAVAPIVIEDASLQDIRVSGVFQVGQSAAFAAALTDLFPVKVKTSGDVISLYRRG